MNSLFRSNTKDGSYQSNKDKIHPMAIKIKNQPHVIIKEKSHNGYYQWTSVIKTTFSSRI